MLQVEIIKGLNSESITRDILSFSSEMVTKQKRLNAEALLYKKDSGVILQEFLI
jgi:hypothetical protein